MQTEDIEKLTFIEIGMGGGIPYNLKCIGEGHPDMNIRGCISVNGKLYRKVYERTVGEELRQSFKKSPKFNKSIFDIFK